MVWRNSNEEKAVIADGRAKAKEKLAKLAKEKVDVKKNVGGGNATDPERQKNTKIKLQRRQRNS